MDKQYLPDPLKQIRAEAKKTNECPIWLTDDFTREHWDIYEICSWFDCDECVATPEDLGFQEDNGVGDITTSEAEASLEIPF